MFVHNWNSHRYFLKTFINFYKKFRHYYGDVQKLFLGFFILDFLIFHETMLKIMKVWKKIYNNFTKKMVFLWFFLYERLQKIIKVLKFSKTVCLSENDNFLTQHQYIVETLEKFRNLFKSCYQIPSTCQSNDDI